MRILVTGANGFLGSALVNLLTLKNVEVIALSTSKFNEIQDLENSLIRRMTLAPNLWKESVSKYSPDIAILCDWNGVDRNKRKLESQSENVVRWTELCTSLIDSGVGKIVALGSQAEVSNNQDMVDEETPFSPRNEYGHAKKMAFNGLSKLCERSGISFVWGRIFSLYGNKMSRNSFLSELATNLILNRECLLSPCNQVWNFLHVDDCSEALWALASSRDSIGIYNLASPSSISLRMVANFLADIEGRKNLLRFGAREYSEREVMVMSPSTLRIQNLGWRQEIEIWDGLTSLYMDFKNRLTLSNKT